MKIHLNIILAICLLMATASQAGSRDQARRIHDRLAGVPPTDAMLDAMETAIDSGANGPILAAQYAMDGAPGESATGDFYTTTLKNWATPWTNESRDSFAPLNDYSATLSAPRMFYAMAQDDHTLPAWFGAIHPRFNTPAHSIIFLGLFALR